MQKLILILVVLFGIYSEAQNFTGVQREDPAYRASGQLVSLVLTPKDKSLKLMLVGYKAAEIRKVDEPRLLSVRVLGLTGKNSLKFQKTEDGYKLLDLPSSGKFDLDLDTEVSGKSETIKMKLNLD